MLSIIIINYNVYPDILCCIYAIKKFTQYNPIEFIIVDNNSSERDIDNILNDHPEVNYIKSEVNEGFGAANNKAIKKAKGDYILLMNPDILVEDNSIDKLVEFLKNNRKVGVAGPILLKPGEGIERYYSFFPSLYSRLMQENWLFQKAPVTKQRFTTFWDKNITRGVPFRVDWVMGAAMMIKKEVILQTGLFDEAFFLYEEETEWQYRMSLFGWERYIVPDAKMIHNHHSSTSKIGNVFREYHEFRSRIIFWAKHDKGIKFVLRYIFIYLGLKIRPIWFAIKYRNSDAKAYKIKKKSTKSLLNLLKSGRKSILNNRFNFNKDIDMFR